MKGKITLKLINIIGNTLFYIFTFCLLVFYRGDFLFRLQELSIFLPNGVFFAEYMAKPAGFLFYISSFLLQFFYYPVLGAFIFTALLALVQYLVYKSFPLGRNLLLISMLPSALILILLTRLDHVIYIMPRREIVYTYVLGAIFVLSFFLLYRKIKPLWAKILYIILLCASYFLVGFYAPITVLLIAVYEITPSWKILNKSTSKTLILNVFAWIISLAIVVVFTCKDKNFDIQLSMERALCKNDFAQILKIADETKDVVPNRTIIQYRNIALSRKGQLLDKMFTYPHGMADYKSDSLISSTIMSAHSIFYHYGRLNFSYRWCMESITKRGLSAEHLKYMAKVATLNEETALAEKYFDILKQTLFHKNWEIGEEEYATIYPLADYDEEFWENSDNVEATILTFYKGLSSGSIEMFELSIAAALTMKDIKPFMNRFQIFLNINDNNPVPVHLQEAAMLFRDLENYEFAQSLHFDPRIVNRYKDFHRVVSSIKGEMSEEKIKKIQKRFGDTYWFYYFFNDNLTTN